MFILKIKYSTLICFQKLILCTLSQIYNSLNLNYYQIIKMEFFKKLGCCIPKEQKDQLKDYQTTQTPMTINTKPQEQIHTQQQTLEQNQNIIQNIDPPQIELKHEPKSEPIPIVIENNQCDFIMCQAEYQNIQTTYELGFVKKPYEVQTAYLIRYIKHEVLPDTSLYCHVSLKIIHQKLHKFKKRVIFYCMCVPGINSCIRGKQFIQCLKGIPLYLAYFTMETNLKNISKCGNILPILGGPSCIRSLEQTQDWIILDYGQHGPCNNLIKENSPSYNKTISTLSQAFYKCKNVAIIFPWGVTKSEVYDIHSNIVNQLDQKVFNFDIQIHSFRCQSDETQLLIGFYGEGVKFKSQQLKEAYPKCIINLFDSLPNQQDRLYAVIDYLTQFYGYQEFLKMLCEMRKLDQTPENVMASLYSKLKEISTDKGVMLMLSGEGMQVDIFDSEADISMCTKKIIERKLSHEGDHYDGKNNDDYSYRERFYKANRSRFFSRQFQSQVSSNTQDDLSMIKDQFD